MKQAVITKAKAFFTDPALRDQMLELPFEKVAKVLSDLVHHGFVVGIAQRFVELFPATTTRRQEGEVGEERGDQ